MPGKSLRAALGSTLPSGNVQVTIFIPDKDCVGNSIDQDFWTNQTLITLAALFRGATSFPPGKGAWRDAGGNLLIENTVMVICYTNDDDLDANADSLGKYLRRFGREANQGEVGIIVGNEFHGITDFRDP